MDQGIYKILWISHCLGAEAFPPFKKLCSGFDFYNDLLPLPKHPLFQEAQHYLSLISLAIQGSIESSIIPSKSPLTSMQLNAVNADDVLDNLKLILKHICSDESDPAHLDSTISIDKKAGRQ